MTIIGVIASLGAFAFSLYVGFITIPITPLTISIAVSIVIIATLSAILFYYVRRSPLPHPPGAILRESVLHTFKVSSDGSVDSRYTMRCKCLQEGVCYDEWGFGWPDTGKPVATLEDAGFWSEGDGIAFETEEDTPLVKRLRIRHGPPLRKGRPFTVSWGYKWPEMVHNPANPGEDIHIQRFPHPTKLYELEMIFDGFSVTDIGLVIVDHARNPIIAEISRVSKRGFKHFWGPDGTYRINLRVRNPYTNLRYGVKWTPLAFTTESTPD